MERNTTGRTNFDGQHEIWQMSCVNGPKSMNPETTYSEYLNCTEDCAVMERWVRMSGDSVTKTQRLKEGILSTRGLAIVGDPTKKANVIVECVFDEAGLQAKYDEGYVAEYPEVVEAPAVMTEPEMQSESASEESGEE